VQGTPFGRYQLIELLGRGGMGEVWRAHDTAIDRMVAIKTLLPHFAQDKTFEQRFRREARVAARLDDPHVVPIYDVGEIDSRLFVAMRLVTGDDLQTLINHGPLDPGRAVHIIEHVASALHAAHKVGLVHRDVKPSNVLIAEDDFAYLIDFGIARAAGETGLTSTGATIGTWSYMAPERFSSGEIEPSSDIYALACVLYQSLTGQLPFPGTTLEQVAMAHMTTPPPKPSARRRFIPTAMDDVIAAGLAKDPSQRYPAARDLAQSARAALTTPVRHTMSRTSLLATQPAVAALPRTVAAKRSSQYVQKFLPLAGRWAKVVATGDDHYGQIGRISAVCDDDDDGEGGLDVIVEFRGDSRSYAFRQDELIAASAPANAAGSGESSPKALPEVKPHDGSVIGLIFFMIVLVVVAVLVVVLVAALHL
jgi:serine/threonine protein kinase